MDADAVKRGLDPVIIKDGESELGNDGMDCMYRTYMRSLACVDVPAGSGRLVLYV